MKTVAFCVTLAITILFSFFLGCSSNGITTAGELPEASAANYGNPYGEQVLGVWDVILDTDKMEISMTPFYNRGASAVGDPFFDIELTDFMGAGHSFSWNTISDLGVVDDSGNGDPTPDIVFTIFLQHPIGQFDSALPASSSNRADLDVFDTRIFILTAGNQAIPLPPDSEAGGVVDTGFVYGNDAPILANISFVQDPDGLSNVADGHSVDTSDGLTPEELAELLTYNEPDNFPGTTHHPFLWIFGGSNADGGTNNPTPGDNRMSQGEDPDMVTVQLNVGPGEGVVRFGLAVAGSFGQAAQGKANRTPDKCKYFVPAFRTNEPIILDVQVVPPEVCGGTVVDGSAAIHITDAQIGAANVAASMEDYRDQDSDGDLLPPEIIDYSDPAHPVISGLTLADYIFGDTGTISYTLLDSSGDLAAVEVEFSASGSTGTGTPADPYVFQFPLRASDFTCPLDPYYWLLIKVSSGKGILKEEISIRVIRFEIA